jgi:hypothetical protein
MTQTGPGLLQRSGTSSCYKPRREHRGFQQSLDVRCWHRLPVRRSAQVCLLLGVVIGIMGALTPTPRLKRDRKTSRIVAFRQP